MGNLFSSGALFVCWGFVPPTLSPRLFSTTKCVVCKATTTTANSLPLVAFHRDGLEFAETFPRTRDLCKSERLGQNKRRVLGTIRPSRPTSKTCELVFVATQNSQGAAAPRRGQESLLQITIPLIHNTVAHACFHVQYIQILGRSQRPYRLPRRAVYQRVRSARRDFSKRERRGHV